MLKDLINQKKENRIAEDDPARLRWGDVFAPTKNKKNQFTVRHIYTFDGTIEVQNQDGLWITMKAINVERGLVNGSIEIVKDGPDTDPRMETL